MEKQAMKWNVVLAIVIGLSASLLSPASLKSQTAQVLCFEDCPSKAPNYTMIDYGRALAKGWARNEWHPAQITETTVTWQDDTPNGAITRYYSFNRYSGRLQEKLVHHPPYTNPPYYSEWQCRPVECPKPRY